MVHPMIDLFKTDSVSSAALTGQPQTILLVEDEPRIRLSLQHLLAGTGRQLFESETGLGAIALLQCHDIDLVLLDINLPDITGLKVMEWIAANKPSSYVIFVSSDIKIDSAIIALRSGAKDFIRKPYEPEQLQIKVEQALCQRRLERSHALMTMRLQHSERLHRFLVEHSPDLVYTLDPTGCFMFVNNRFETMLGYAREELLGQPYFTIVHEEDIAKAHYAFNERRKDNRVTTNIEVRLKCKNNGYRTVTGHHIVAMLSAMGIYTEEESGSDDNFLGTYGVARDISERKLAEETIAFHAYHDHLTHLPNQRLFKDRLEMAMANSKRRGVMVGIMFIDLDRFKLVNDTYGHAEGDELLKIVAQRLNACMRSGDTVARKGGDEFVVLLPDLYYAEDATIIAAKILDSFSQPFKAGGQECRVTASIGIAIYPRDGESVDTLLKHADIAMYRVKTDGKNDLRFYTPDMSDGCKNRISFENQLRQAIGNADLELHYQPQIRVPSMQVICVEALVRWRHPTFGLLNPADFLEVAEESGMIGAITDWVLHEACRQLAAWRRVGLDNLRMAVNVSPQEFDRPDLVQRIADLLQKHQVPPHLLEIELTENILMRNSGLVVTKMKQLRELGVELSIDDFGTCYSSLNYLRLLPVTAIKIDKSFVRDITEKQHITPIIPAIIGIARGFGLHLVAEGIENDYQIRTLQSLGCSDMQGYYFSCPLPGPEAEHLLLGRAA